jgi:hypothetical protein
VQCIGMSWLRYQNFLVEGLGPSELSSILQRDRPL